MDNSTINNILKELISYFETRKIPYVIVGGLSVLTWGRIRSTEDIDIIIDHTTLDLNDFVEYLKNNNYHAELNDFMGFKEGDHCTLLKKDSLFRIDLMGKHSVDHEISLKEAKEIEYQGIKLRIDSPESLIAHKLRFGAEFDIEDATAVIIRLNERLDIQKLVDHTVRLGVHKQLRDLIKRIHAQNENLLVQELLNLIN